MNNFTLTTRESQSQLVNSPSSQKEHALSPTQKRWLNWSIIEGGLSAVYASLCGGVFIIGLAVSWGAGELVVGVIGASPLFAMVATFVGAWLLERGYSRRAVTIGSMLVARLLWFPFIASYPFLVTGNLTMALAVLIVLTLISALVGAIGQMSWLGWMTEIVPLEIRGRYFGIRNAVFGLMTTIAIYMGGKFVNWNFGKAEASKTAGYFGLFFIGAIAGAVGIIAMSRIGGGRPEISAGKDSAKFWELVKLPLAVENFRTFLIFQFVWMFGVYMSAPFFAVMMLREFNAGIEYVGLVTAVGALANVITFRGWGILADRYGNRPIMVLCCIFSAAFPLWWFFFNPTNYYTGLIVFHFLAGISWAGYTLTSYNLLLKLSPAEHNSIYLSLFNSLTGLSTAVAPLVGGALAIFFEKAGIEKLFSPLLAMFFIASVVRYSSLLLLRKVKEPQETPVIEVLRVLRSARGFNTLMGFDAVIHFLTVTVKKRKNSLKTS